MGNDKSDSKGTSRKEFIRRTAAGVFGTVMTGMPLGEYPPLALAFNPNLINRIAFGSCASQDAPQPIWDSIIGKDPDLFLFIGDNIYADTQDMALMREKYRKLGQKSGYQRLRNTCKVLSTWDDHDYGENDAGAGYPKKEESEQIFLDFFDVPEDSPRRQRPGVYGSHIYGPAGKRVQVILLDTRYFKDLSGRQKNTMSEEEKEQKNIVGWYLPNENSNATLLGEAQWTWLEQQLQKEAEFRIIASSIQVIPFEKGMECWGNYPHERERLFSLVNKTGANGVMFISGDVHFSEISKTDEGPYPLYDFTSSGMTHSNAGWSKRKNSFRLGDAYAGLNAGLIQIDWEREDPAIGLKTMALDGSIKIEHQINLSELQPG